MRRSSLVLSVLLLVACSTLPKPGKPAMPDIQFRMREFRLANGMRILVEEDHASPLVGVFTVVGVGGSGDPKGREGLAHLIEHLAFRSTPYNRGTSWNQLENSGVGFLNAMTELDSTMYMEVATKDLLPSLLTLEAGRLFNPLVGVDQKTFDVEREIVRNELRQGGENRIGPAFRYLQEAVFQPSHAYSRPVVGTHESLNAITFDDAKQFVAKNYQPANMTMLIIGDVELEHIQEQLMRALPMSVFQPLPPTREPFPARLKTGRDEPPPLPAAKLIKRQSTVASPELYVVWSLPRSFDAENVLLDFVTGAAASELSGAFASDPDIAGVNVFPLPGAEASMLVAQVLLQKGDHVERSYERVLDQLVKIWASGESGQELGGDETSAVFAKEVAFIHQRNAAVMDLTVSGENLLERGTERVKATHFTGDPLMYSRRLHALTEVSPGQVTHFAETYLQRDRARAVLVEPYPAGSKDATPGTTGLAPTGTDAQTVSFGAEAVKKLGRAHLALGSTFESVVHAKRESITETLPNGLQVVIRHRAHSLPVVVTELAFTAGAAGTDPRGAPELGRRVARPRKHAYGAGYEYGIDWQLQVRDDHTQITGVGASGNVGNMVAQLSEMVTSMHVEPRRLDFYKREIADYLEKSEGLPLVKAETDLRAQLFRGHPLSVTTLIADQRKLRESDIEGWFERAFTPRGAVLVIAGDIDAEKTLLDVKQYLGDWAAPKNPFAPLPAPTLRTDAAPTIVVTQQASASQAQLHLACLTGAKTLEQELANDTLASLLGTQLFNKVRQELGASYGIHGSASTLLGGTGRIDWRGSIENSRLPEALAVIRGLLGRFETEVLTEPNFERARWEVARGSTLDNATAQSVTSTLLHEVLMGRNPDLVNQRFEHLAAQQRGQISEAWKQCQGTTVLSLVGDEQRIRASLKEAGF